MYTSGVPGSKWEGVKFSEKGIVIKWYSFCYPSYAWDIFATILHQMGPWGPTKGNDQLTR